MQSQMFGGPWTEDKLDVLQGYLNAYTKALKNMPFELVYIDAFAGTGYREEKAHGPTGKSLFPELTAGETQAFLAGSARRSLMIERPFDRYVFVDKSPAKAELLEGLRSEWPALASRIEVLPEDCNTYLQRVCKHGDWRGSRAVLFLDPFGMQVEWDTMEAVASTHVFDVWILFPVSAVNRLLRKDANISAAWRNRLTKLFGTTAWYKELYRADHTRPLFGGRSQRRTKVRRLRDIWQYYYDRLAATFSRVTDSPKWLRNTKNTPLFVFCFGVSNPSLKAQELALRIADYLLKD